jgi:O-antigen/teichoic acid export membrane protein
MEERAVRGVPWTFLSFGATKVVMLLATVVLARLLDPADFGLMALALLAFHFFGLLRDLGLGATVVLRQDFDRAAQGTVLTLMLLTALAMTILVAATAPLAALALDEPRLNSILPALAATSLLGSVAWFFDSVMQRELEFRRRFAGLMAQTLAYAGVAIALAAAGVGVWSLVLGQVAGMAVYAGTFAALAPYRPRPAFDKKIAREAVSTGGGFLAQGGLGWVHQNVDYLIVGRMLGTAPLGFYSMAYRLSELTHFGIADPIAKVTFPGFVRMRHRGEDVSHVYLGTLRLVALITCPIGAVLSGVADPFVAALFGDAWLPMVGVLAVLGVWAAVKPVEATAAWLLNSVGDAWSVGKVYALLLVPVVPLLVLAADDGITAVAWVILAEGVASLALLAMLIARRAAISLVAHLRVLWPIALAAAAAWLGARGVSDLAAGLPPAATLALGVLAGLACFIAAVSILEPGTIRFAARQVTRALGREPTAAGAR